MSLSYHIWHLSNHLSFSLGFSFDQAKKNIYDNKNISEAQMGAPYDILYKNVYEKPHSARLTPDSTYGI